MKRYPWIVLASDTIVAPITGTQRAAVAWVRLSGPDSWSIAAHVFQPWPADPESHRATFGWYGEQDSGLALPFAEGHSYTGEQSVELSLHGSTVSVRSLVERCIECGARMAEPGEFTLRAFLNGRIDLTQAEAVRDSVDATTERQLRSAQLNLKGGLRREVSALRGQVLKVLAAVEASVDFSEEIGDLNRTVAAEQVQSIVSKLNTLLSTAHAGMVVRNGYRIAIVGPPNAGKSSVLNALLGADRSIVTPVAGTTRDYVEETLEVGGLAIVLIDTAGLRSTTDVVESIGIERTREIASSADAVWYLYDSSVGWTDDDSAALANLGRDATVLANKCDLAHADTGQPISAVTREGLGTLLEQVVETIRYEESSPLINSRHEPLLRSAVNSLEECLNALESDAPDDLLSVLLADAAMQLGQITGETATPDMVERIFHDFCVGK